jgi:hypothetical protein
LKNASRNRETSKAHLAKSPEASPSPFKVPLYPGEKEAAGKEEITELSLT